MGASDFGLQALTLIVFGLSCPSTGISRVLGLLVLVHVIGLLTTKPVSPVGPFPVGSHYSLAGCVPWGSSYSGIAEIKEP